VSTKERGALCLLAWRQNASKWNWLKITEIEKSVRSDQKIRRKTRKEFFRGKKITFLGEDFLSVEGPVQQISVIFLQTSRLQEVIDFVPELQLTIKLSIHFSIR
jgi:hypothetical protein